MDRVVIHIAPLLPPQNSGVGDYAMLVGRRMEEIGGVRCGYVAAGHTAVEQPANGAQMRNITGRCEATSLWQAVDELATTELFGSQSQNSARTVSIVLNFSGYGYERNGCPAWLVEALCSRPKWLDRVVTYFHELYATGRPWRRAFWYSARQRKTTAEIARRSDAVFTNREQNARWLEKHLEQAPGSVVNLAVPSNVGEPSNTLAIDARRRRAVTFGGATPKVFALRQCAEDVAVYLRHLGITELVDLGARAPIAKSVFERHGIAVKQLGVLPAAEVSEILRQSRLGLLDYPMNCVAKSGVYAAFAAHGVVPIMRRATPASTDGLLAKTHYFGLHDCACEVENELNFASANILRWYHQHDIDRHALAIRERLSNGAWSATAP